MRIGVVSDTHNNLRNVHRLIELFNDADVDRVVHTGDITQAKVLAAMSELEAPLFGVYGNNDQERDALVASAEEHGHVFVDPPLEITWADRRVVVVHEPPQLVNLELGAYELALHGHTHMRRVERERGQLVFNPGESAGHMKGHNAVGIVNLATLVPEVLLF